jgi:hypothetical protein
MSITVGGVMQMFQRSFDAFSSRKYGFKIQFGDERCLIMMKVHM